MGKKLLRSINTCVIKKNCCLFIHSFTLKLKYPLLAKSEEVGRGGYQVHIYYIWQKKNMKLNYKQYYKIQCQFDLVLIWENCNNLFVHNLLMVFFRSKTEWTSISEDVAAFPATSAGTQACRSSTERRCKYCGISINECHGTGEICSLYSRVCYIENLDLTNFWENKLNVHYIEV